MELKAKAVSSEAARPRDRRHFMDSPGCESRSRELRLLRFDSGRLDDRAPPFRFALVEFRERSRRAATGNHVAAAKVRLGLRRLEIAVHRFVPALHERFREALRTVDAVPDLRFEA